jgi:hypothetical protein
MTWRLALRVVALVLACDYFAFQVELFDDEYQANHPRTSDSSSVTGSAFTWESFDKENAPEAFTVDPWIEIRPLFVLTTERPLPLPPVVALGPIRDKSPPPLPVKPAA